MQGLTNQLMELKELRAWHTNNARRWATDPNISILDAVNAKEYTLFPDEFMTYEYEIRKGLEQKLKDGSFVRAKDPFLQSFFIMYGLEFGRYSLFLDDMCGDIIAAKGKSQYEDLGIEEVGNSVWAEPLYHFEEGLLKINKDHWSDGGYKLSVDYNNKHVFGLFDDGGYTDMKIVRTYIPGVWEKEVKRLYDSLPKEILPEASQSTFKFMEEIYFEKPYQPNLPISSHFSLSEEFSFNYPILVTSLASRTQKSNHRLSKS